MCSSFVCRLLLVFVFASAAKAAETETQYLSGHGKDDPIRWQFMCDSGMHAGEWSTIGVPSNWELQGFGIYTYGRPNRAVWPRVHGVYKRTFTTPAKWRGHEVFLKFEGVMTDAQVRVNGESAGPVHQGGYYAFKYDITKLLKPAGQKNELQVDVDDDSKNESVNKAERRGDFWNYGGIFRPVYLEAVPKTFIDHVAISAGADGSLALDVKASDTRASAVKGAAFALEAQVVDMAGKPVGQPLTATAVGFDAPAHLVGHVSRPRLWSAETPDLYEMDVRLKSGGKVVHEVRERFGFRTVEVLPGQGLLVNGQRVFLKGFARHSFWPDSGRTLSVEVSREDVNLIKEMNGNAVRTSHYPPDGHLLDMCDELGLYVLDELAGWHGNYDTETGKKLVKEMVEHDVNHPSIIFWDNGNEGGFNTDLDGEFAKYDPEQRTVLHPWAEFPVGIVDTKHYPTYEQMLEKLAARPVYFPTEMLHGLYDGGAGAGLNEYWDAILKSKAGAGGFLWAFLDEDVKRVDKGGVLDSAGNQAPDGIVGPYREREGSFYTVKQIWSPIVVTASTRGAGAYTVSNRYSFTNADQCTFEWEAIAFARPGDDASGSVVLASRVDHGRSLAPGTSETWENWGPPAAGANADAVRLRIKDAAGRVIATYVWPTREMARVDAGAGAAKVDAKDSADAVTVSAGDLSVQISKRTGMLVGARRQGQRFSFSDGPRVVAITPRLPPPSRKQQAAPAPVRGPEFAPESKLVSLTHREDGRDMVVEAVFSGPLKSVTYRLRPNGWVRIEYAYGLTGEHEYFGVGFDYPEGDVQGMRYLGEGPSPVYQNRLAGGTLDVWDRPYNNTVVGDADDLTPGEHFEYPVFKGFYAGVRWMELKTVEGPITMVVDQGTASPAYVQVFTPKTPPLDTVGQAYAMFPQAGISFLQAISAVGSKFVGPRSSGPMGQPAVGHGEYRGAVSLYFGKLGKE